MPIGKVNSGDFRKGTPIILPHQFGTPVSIPEPQGNVIPQSNPTLNGNPVTWVVSPAHFGNTVEFSLQSVPPIVLIEAGGTGSVNINLTQLLDSPTATLTFSGADWRNNYVCTEPRYWRERGGNHRRGQRSDR